MKTTRTTVFLSLAILASFLLASSAFADVTYTNSSMPGETLVTGTGEGGVGAVTFNITGTNPVYYDGQISGTGSITKSGAGELILTYPSTDYSGAVNVNAGVLTLSGSGQMSGSVTVNSNNNNVSIFKCGATYSGITNLTVNGGTYEIGANYDSTAGNYLSDFTLTGGGYIEFDAYTFVAGAEGQDLQLDYLYVNNGVLNSGVINLTFRSNDEMAWHDGAPTEGYPIIDAGADLTFNESAIKIYADGQQTDNWYLSQVGNSIYLKPKSSQPQPPQDDPWYYANSQTDLSRDVWEMNKNPKIGVKFPEGNLNTAEFGSADNSKSIVMTKNGDFTQGEYQIADGKTLTIYATISGDADLLKTGAGTLVLNGNNTYTGKTYVTEGTLTLATAGSTGTLKGGSEIIVDGSKGTAILSGQGDVFSWGANAPAKISLINGGILQNDGDTNHSTMGAVIEMNNGIIQTKNAEATGTSGVGSYIMDNAIHVIGGQNNAINLNEFSIRHLDGTRYAAGEDAGYFDIAEGAKLTINAKMDSYGGVTNLPIVKTGKGELELTKRNENIKSDFIIKEGKVIGSAPNNGSSTFGYGTLIIEDGALLDCHDYNQFGYGDNVQPNIVVRGTLIPYTDTHMHNITLESGTIESENGSGGIGLDFYNRTGTITSSGTSVIKSQLSRGGNITFNVTDGELTISGNNNITAPMTKTGAGTLKLTNANTSTGAYTIQEGVVVAGNEIALGTGAVTITGDATTNAVGQLTIGALPAEPLDLTVSGKVTLDGGQINFDFTADDFDTLIAANGFQFDTGTFNLHFASGTEATLYQNAPEAGYQIVSITGGSYSGDEDLSDFLSGINQDWTLTATNDGIYLGKSSTPVQESEYWNPISDDGIDWPIDGENKIGVKYDDESNEGDPKTASHDQNITLDADGDFIIGEDYEFEQAGPISGNGKLTKTGAGALFLTGENSYKGGTDIEEGSVVLVTDDESDGTAGVGPIEIAENGELVYNVAANQTKTIDNAITGKGTITKTGAGTLQANGAGDTPLQAGEFNVEQGRLDLMGEFTGDVHVVGPLDDDGNEVAAVLSPGNSVGNATVYGDVTIDAGATGLFEFSAYNNDPLLRSFDTLSIENDGQFITSEDAEKIIKLSFLSYDDAKEWANEENDPYLIIEGGGFTDGAPYSAWLANFNNMFDLLGGADGLFLVPLGAQDMPGVPEPSTWALLLLGAAGLCWMRRRK